MRAGGNETMVTSRIIMVAGNETMAARIAETDTGDRMTMTTTAAIRA